MTYVITKETKQGLHIGQIEYKTKTEAEERANELRAKGHEVKVMTFNEAVGID